MPIHDQSYRRYRGGKASPGQAWTVITAAGIMTMLRKRAFLGLLIFAWLPFVVRAVQLYLSTNFPQMAILAPTAETFREFLDHLDRAARRRSVPPRALKTKLKERGRRK